MNVRGSLAHARPSFGRRSAYRSALAAAVPPSATPCRGGGATGDCRRIIREGRRGRNTLWVLGSLLFSASAMGCPLGSDDSDSGESPDPEAIATVNGQSISPEVVADGLRRFRREHGKLAFRAESDLETVRKHLLEQQIDRVLIEQRSRQMGLAVDEEDVERALLRRKASYPDRTFEEYLVEAGLPLSELFKETRHRLLLQELFAREVNPRVEVGREDIKEHFNEDPSAWALEEQVRARHIVAKTEEEAEQLRSRLRRGEDFANLAMMHSQGPEGQAGGDLGWFTKGTMPPPIDDVCFSLPVGRVSEVIESPYGFHIFEVLERREARPRELSEVERTISSELRLKKEHEAQQAYLKKLREEATIVIHEDVLAEVR